MVSLLVGLVIAAMGIGSAPMQAASETASQFYMRYRVAVDSATSMEDVLPFWSGAAANEYRSAPPDQKVDLAGFRRMTGLASHVRVTHETVTADAATLTLEGTSRDQKRITGTAHLVKEDGGWKLASPESWNTSEGGSPSAAAARR